MLQSQQLSPLLTAIQGGHLLGGFRICGTPCFYNDIATCNTNDRFPVPRLPSTLLRAYLRSLQHVQKVSDESPASHTLWAQAFSRKSITLP